MSHDGPGPKPTAEEWELANQLADGLDADVERFASRLARYRARLHADIRHHVERALGMLRKGQACGHREKAFGAIREAELALAELEDDNG